LPLAMDFLLAILSFLVFLLAGYEYLALMHFPILTQNDPKTATSERPFVSIVLPVRNQANTINECIESLTGLDYPRKEIIVVEGDSTDGTKEALAKYQGKILIVREEPLPEGWVGKNWACQLGYERAQGTLLLFTDGDSVHSPDSLSRTVETLQSTSADMLSLAPRPILKSFWEKTLQPPIFLLIMLFVGGKWVNDDKRSNALGNGQYMLFRREAYEKIGTHRAVRNKITEDYNLARLLKKAGLRLRVLSAPDALGVRMYASFGEIWRGWRKNFYSVAGTRSTLRSILRLALMLALFVLPFAVLAWGIIQFPAAPLNTYLLAGAFMATLLWLGILVLDRSIGVGPGYALLLPLAILIYAGIGMDSTFRGVFGLGFSWKGRLYGQRAHSVLEEQIA
jgi:chlorobactene glucosyltransferase